MKAKTFRLLSEFDKTNDVHTHDRNLDRPLYLVVERKIGSIYHWDLPTTIRKEGETLRQTAERAGTMISAVFTIDTNK